MKRGAMSGGLQKLLTSHKRIKGFGWVWRFGVAIFFDVLDFTILRIPGLETLSDIVLGGVGLWLWGPIGGLQFVEVIDLTGQLDAQLPTLTLAGIIKLINEKS